MVADSAFTLTNLSKVESILHRAFPKLNIKKTAIVEGIVGFIIILFKLSTQSLK